jgi:hypothetical protein
MIRHILGADQEDQRRTSSRAQAEQLDFLNAMILLLAGVFFFFGFSAVVFGLGAESQVDLSQTPTNADERLVEDMLVNQPGDSYLDQDCTDDYFGMTANASCGITGFDTSAPNESHWLRHSLGVEDRYSVNVTIADGSSILTNSTGTSYALGPSVPSGRNVATSTRYVSFDGSAYYLVRVRVW